MFRYLADSYSAKYPDDVLKLIEIDLRRVSIFHVVRILWSLRGSLVFWNCSVLGIHWYFLLIAKMFGARIALYPHLVVDHRLLESKFAKIRNAQMMASLRLVDYVVSISEGNDERIRNIHRKTKLVPVRNFVESENLEAFHGGLNYRRVAVIGRIQEKHKGQVALLKALKPILGKGSFCIDFFGSGPDEESLKSCIESLGLGECCVLHGWKTEPEIYKNDFGIVINYSRWEGLSLGLLEAIFHNRIVVGNDILGNRELLDQNRLFKNEDELVQLMVDLQKTPEDALILEANAKKHEIQRKYSKNLSLSHLHEFTTSRC